MVADAIYSCLPDPKEISPVETAPDPEDYQFLAVGFWVDKGTADQKAREYMTKIRNKKIGVFGTLGAYPDSDHANTVRERVRELLKENDIMDLFLCQGKVDPELVKMMAETMKDDPHHSMTPERRARLKEAEKHPDEDDLKNAQKVFEQIMVSLNN